MQNKDNVTYGKPRIGGAIYCAPVGTELPSDAVTPLGSAFKSLGYCSEDGLTNANSPETEDIKAWGGDSVLTIQTGKEDKFTFTLIEVLNVGVLKLVYGEDNVEGDLETGITVKANSQPLQPNTFVIDQIMKGGVLKRIVVSSADIAELGEVPYNDEDAVGYEITLSAKPDEDGNTHIEYIQKKGSSVGDE